MSNRCLQCERAHILELVLFILQTIVWSDNAANTATRNEAKTALAVGQAEPADDDLSGDAEPVSDDDDEESAELKSEDCKNEILGVTMELVFGIMPFDERLNCEENLFVDVWLRVYIVAVVAGDGVDELSDVDNERLESVSLVIVIFVPLKEIFSSAAEMFEN